MPEKLALFSSGFSDVLSESAEEFLPFAVPALLAAKKVYALIKKSKQILKLRKIGAAAGNPTPFGDAAGLVLADLVAEAIKETFSLELTAVPDSWIQFGGIGGTLGLYTPPSGLDPPVL